MRRKPLPKHAINMFKNALKKNCRCSRVRRKTIPKNLKKMLKRGRVHGAQDRKKRQAVHVERNARGQPKLNSLLASLVDKLQKERA